MKKLPKTHQSQLIEQELYVLKEWSGFQSITVIFDSDLQGNGSIFLQEAVYNKQNLYFISIDDSNNVHGGYLTTMIKKKNEDIHDDHAFLFSLFRNGEIKNKQYFIKKGHEDDAFFLSCYGCGNLYGFGYSDIGIDKVGCKESYYCPNSFCFEKEFYPLVDKVFPDKFIVKRIIVLQMN